MNTFLPAYRIITAPQGNPNRIVFILHGILGSGKNWRSFAKRLAKVHPEWGFVLVDQRNHGDTGQGPAPHRLMDCAEDLARLAQEVGEPECIVGHSFGGKVALVYGREYGNALRQIWVLDACPGARREGSNTDTDRMFEFLSAIEMPISSRAVLAERLEGHGIDSKMAAWMLTNLRPRAQDGQADGYDWRFYRPGVEAMVRDFYEVDLWDTVSGFRPPIKVHLVRAGRGHRWSSQDIEELDHVSLQTHVSSHLIENSGHWVHVDAPEVLFRLISDSLG